MRIDAHQHYWRYKPAQFPWIGAAMSLLARDHEPAEIAPGMRAHGIEAAIAVQARPLEAETDELLARAAATPWVAGVVGWADLAAADVGDRLAAWRARGPLVGVRAIVQDAPDAAALLVDPAFNRGVAAAQAQGLVYELLVTSAQLEDALAFCRRHDRHGIVLDHLGKPDIRGGEWAPWAASLNKLAALPHVACKLSGLVTQAAWSAWTVEELARYGRFALECFGGGRVMFGSDWPVCTLAASYGEVVQVAEAALTGASDSERAMVFGGNAAGCYGLAAAEAGR